MYYASWLIFRPKRNTQHTLIGTNEAPMMKNGVQLSPAVSIGMKQIDKMVPNVAAAPPSPANEPTLLPVYISLASVWILFIVNWNPKRMIAMQHTATIASCTNAT